jgi:hypothetical protein
VAEAPGAVPLGLTADSLSVNLFGCRTSRCSELVSMLSGRPSRGGRASEHRVKAELPPHRTRGQHRSPVPRADRTDIIAFDATIVGSFAVQEAAELAEIEMRCQKIPATAYDAVSCRRGRDRLRPRARIRASRLR